MDFRSYADSTSMEIAIRRREREQYLYSERRLPRHGNDYEYDFMYKDYPPLHESFHRMPYSDERFPYPEPLRFHPYNKPVRHPLLKGLPAVPSYLPHLNRSLNISRNKFTKEDSCCLNNVFKVKSHKRDKKLIRAEILPSKDENFKPTIKLETNVAESESSIINYCLDRCIQHTISRLQNDFRLTKKFKTFSMYEKPLIEDFKPTPVTTAFKFHNRFKCLSRQLLNVNDENIDLDPELEKATEEDVLKNVTEVEK